MSRLPVRLALALALASPLAAEAQLSNFSFGLEGGYANHDGVGVEPHVPFGLTTSMYLESDFEATVRFTLGFPAVEFDGRTAFYVRPALGLRYNLLAENLRPQLMVELALFQYFSSVALNAGSVFAPGAGGGLELFFARDLSLTLLGMYHRMLVFDGVDANNYEAMVRFTSYF